MYRRFGELRYKAYFNTASLENDANDTERQAYDLYRKISESRDVVINNIEIPYIEMLSSEPIDVGTDDKGIYERVIELNIYYKI